MHPSTEFYLLVGLYALLAAFLDFKTHKIPNWLTVPTAVLGLAYHAAAPGGMGIGHALIGFVVGFVVLLLPWILGGGGMGDVKLLAALGTWIGWQWVLVTVGLGSVLGAMIAVVVMATAGMQTGMLSAQRQYLGVGGNPADIPEEDSGRMAKPKKRKRAVPFAVPIAVATLAVLAYIATHQ
ncbi:MAG: A24 family peptidase [Planctomycetaceae bacterium]